MYAELKRKICRQCKEEKSVNLFRYRKQRNSYETYCKACEYLNSKKWAVDNKDRRREIDFEKNLRCKFGLTTEKYYTMLMAQGNGCAICTKEKSLSGRALAVDHNHQTGEIRGLLCNECNTSIGLLKENVETLKSAVRYINKFKK